MKPLHRPARETVLPRELSDKRPHRCPKNPRPLVGHLRRAQTFLRALGIDIAFSR